MPKAEFWQPKLRTAVAMTRLCWARLLVAWIPLERWRHTLGSKETGDGQLLEKARGLAADIEWAAKRLPFSTKCLPRAMALSWTLRRERIAHVLVFAVRPPERRESSDDLHAWVEAAGEKVLGDLPGRWVETLRLGD